MSIANKVGNRYGRLLVEAYDGKSKWLCRCDCGNSCHILGSSLEAGSTTSCGCLRKELLSRIGKASKKHGETGTRLYIIWSAMKTRTMNKKDIHYADYGGRGISVCKEWVDSYINFKDWAMANGYSKKLTIDRINNDQGCSPDNCRWATKKEQQSNRRNNRIITISGVSLPMIEWSKLSGISISGLVYRVKQNWTDEQILSPSNRNGLKPRKEMV